MTDTEVVLQGALTPDGKLELAEPVSLRPGPVEVRVRTVEPEGRTARPLEDVLRDIRRRKEARGFRPRPMAEILADIDALRDEWEE